MGPRARPRSDPAAPCAGTTIVLSPAAVYLPAMLLEFLLCGELTSAHRAAQLHGELMTVPVFRHGHTVHDRTSYLPLS